MTKKHSRNTNLADEIERGLDRYITAAERLPAMVARLRETTIEAAQAVNLIAQAGENGLMPHSHLWDVVREFHCPTHPEHGTGTGWALMNAFTEIVKRNPPNRQMTQADKFRQMVLSA